MGRDIDRESNGVKETDREGALPVEKEALRARLNERIVALTERVDQIEGELGQPLDDDFVEQAVDREDDQALDTLERSTLAEIELIRRAIARLDTGSYGTCIRCGDAIAIERLNALPAAETCIACARIGSAVRS